MRGATATALLPPRGAVSGKDAGDRSGRPSKDRAAEGRGSRSRGVGGQRHEKGRRQGAGPRHGCRCRAAASAGRPGLTAFKQALLGSWHLVVPLLQ